MDTAVDKHIGSAGRAALAEARRGVAQKHGGPFGAVILRGGRVVAKGHNTVMRDHDPIGHAEMNAISRAARRLGSPHLRGCLLVTTSEPCPMCLAAAYWAGIRCVYFILPKHVAAAYGFSDEFIYKELKRPARARCIREAPLADLAEEAAALFREWKRGHGRLY